MSATLQWKQHAPRGHQWTRCSEGEDGLEPRTYAWLAYTHPDCNETWFATRARAVVRRGRDQWVHVGLVSLVNDLELPPKLDLNVFAIPTREAMRLWALEHLWWADYNAHLSVYNNDHEARMYAHQRVQDRKNLDLDEDAPPEEEGDGNYDVDYGDQDRASDDVDPSWHGSQDEENLLDAGDDHEEAEGEDDEEARVGADDEEDDQDQYEDELAAQMHG